MQNQEYINPIVISCPTCNQSMDFEIEKDNFKCEYCNTLTPIKEAFKLKLDKSISNQKQIKQDISQTNEALCTCQVCGAKIFIEKDKLVNKCDFCDSSIILDSINNIDRFPEYYIEFEIDKKTAENNLLDWCKKNPKLIESQIIRDNIQKLKQYFLPYEIVSGTFLGQVEQTKSKQVFNYGGFVESVAINTSRQTDNTLLDKVEPFDFTKSKVVNTLFFTDNNIKFSDLDDFSCNNRFKEEVKEQNLDPMRKKILSSKAEIKNIEIKDIIKYPMALPMFVLTIKVNNTVFQAAVNGQTGQTAVRSLNLKEDNTPIKKRNKAIVSTFLITIITVFGFGNYINNQNELFIEILASIFIGGIMSIPVILFILIKMKIGKLNKKFDYYVDNQNKITNTKQSKLYFMEYFLGEYHRIYVNFMKTKSLVIFFLFMLCIIFLPCFWAYDIYYNEAIPTLIETFTLQGIVTWFLLIIPLLVYITNVYFTKAIFQKPDAYYYDKNNQKQKYEYQKVNLKVFSPLRVIIYIIIALMLLLIAYSGASRDILFSQIK